MDTLSSFSGAFLSAPKPRSFPENYPKPLALESLGFRGFPGAVGEGRASAPGCSSRTEGLRGILEFAFTAPKPKGALSVGVYRDFGQRRQGVGIWGLPPKPSPLG